MKNTFLTIIFLTFSLCLAAQSSKKTDSLFTILKTAKADIALVNTYNELSWEYQSSNPDTTLYFAYSALKLAIKVNYKKGMADSYNNIGIFHNYKGDYDKAIEFYFKSLKIYEELDNKKGMAMSYNNIGIICDYFGDYDKAIDFYFKSLKIYEELGDKKNMSASYNNIGNINMYKGNYDKAIDFYFKSLKIYEELGDKKGMAASYGNIGLIHKNKGDYDKAIEFYFKSLKIREELSDKNGMADSYINIGNIHADKGNYDKAIEFYFKSLKIYEELGNKQGMAASYMSIGIIHSDKDDYDKAIDFYFKSLKIYEELGNKQGMAMSYNNIGLIHSDKGDYDKAIDFYFKSLKIFEELNNKNGMAASYINIGLIHGNKGDYGKAIGFYFKSLKIYEELGDKKGISTSYTNIGNLYLKQNKPEEAKKQQLLALNIAKEIGGKDLMYMSYNSLAQCDSALFNFRGAYEYHKLYSQVHDSVFSKESDEKITKMNARYEAEKRELTIQKLEKEKLLQNETLARKEAESKKQRILLFSFLAGFIIILVFSVFLYRLFVQKKMANIILARQKDEISTQRDEIESQRDLVTHQKEYIEHIHEEQTDSIRYAERIQKAVLPVSESAREILGEHFILFKPKDIVSGDFYYIAQRKNILLIAVADCTGHGVPGAFMSMLGISFLNEIIAKEEIQSASHVLNELRQYVINSLQQKGVQGEQQDGMDMSFIAINTETNQLQFSGANNPLYYIPVGSNDLIEIKADKMPVGIYGNMPPFNNNILQVNKGDKIYIFSDGFIDQFGGENKKKFLSKRFKETLLQIAHLPMTEQYENLNNTFENWKGKVEQIDDVTVMGIRIT